MGVVIDNLETYFEYAVRQEFTDAAGVVHPAGERWRIAGIEFEYRDPQFRLKVEGTNGALVIPLWRSGDRKLDHLAVFEKVGEAPPYRPMRRVAPPPPPVVQPATYPEGDYRRDVAAIVGLAVEERFAEADAAYRELMVKPRVFADYTPLMGRDFEAAAGRYARIEYAAAFRWLYEKAIESWSAWASQATSGGEGVAMSRSVKECQARYAEAHRVLAANRSE